MQFFYDLIDAGRRFAPHGYCLLWRPELVWTHVISDAMIAAAYFSIPLALISFIRKRRDLEFSWIFWLFATFIVACGTTHLMAIWTLWHADYAWEALIKMVTAIASVGTAIVLWPLIPRLLAIPSPLQLREKNDHLEQTIGQLTVEMAERRRAEDALRQAQKMEAVGQLTGGIAHDFNNLLQSVTGSLALIARNPGSDKVAKWAELGRQAADRGSRLTAQLLAFSRTQRIELQPCEVAPILDKARDLLATAAGPTVSIVMDLASQGRITVLGDPTQIELAVMNLVLNARDAMPEGGTVTIRTGAEDLAGDTELADGCYLRIDVTDTGSGMPSDVAARAFDPFFTTKGVGKGTGLGLSMVYGVAKQSGGTARIRTAPGAGTTVSIFLPEVQGDTAHDRAEPGTLASTQAANILVVDDDPEVRTMTVTMVEELGHAAREAGSGAEALEMIAASQPDLVVLDFAMPEMNGAQVAAEMRRRHLRTPIVFATGFSDSEAIQSVLNDERFVLRKPYSLAQMAEKIGDALGSDAREREG